MAFKPSKAVVKAINCDVTRTDGKGGLRGKKFITVATPSRFYSEAHLVRALLQQSISDQTKINPVRVVDPTMVTAAMLLPIEEKRSKTVILLRRWFKCNSFLRHILIKSKSGPLTNNQCDACLGIIRRLMKIAQEIQNQEQPEGG